MAALIKGLHYAGLTHDVLTRPRQDSRDHLLSGLRWLFAALGVSSAMYGYESLQPAATQVDAMSGALIGLIPPVRHRPPRVLAGLLAAPGLTPRGCALERSRVPGGVSSGRPAHLTGGDGHVRHPVPRTHGVARAV
jgi:hypothetical protein